MNKGHLGRLERIELREYWEHEATDFTPWLASDENIALLGEEIGIELEVQDQKARVGPFRADILCRDTLNDQYVLIENQLEQTDHLHLGQLLTYAAGLNAVTIIWIARNFTEEHRASLDWLNRITDDSVNFFGVEMELWRIGDSGPAPRFNVVAKPNDWAKTVKQSAAATKPSDLSDIKRLQLDYWSAFRDFLVSQRSFLKSQKPAPQHWTQFAIGRSYFHLVAIANTRDQFIAVYLAMSGTDAKTHFSLLKNHYSEEALPEFGSELEWRELPQAKESHVYIKRVADPRRREEWTDQFSWLKNSLERFHRFFAARVKELDADDLVQDEEVTEPR